MILTISKWLAYVPLICFLDIILLGKQEDEEKKGNRILKAVALVILVFGAGFILTGLLKQWVDLDSVPRLSEILRWNIHNIILFHIFMIIKIHKNRKRQQILFIISVTSCLFAVIQIVFYYYLFLIDLKGLTPDIIGIITLCSMAILFTQGAILELMEKSIDTQIRQNEDEMKLLEKKYEQDYYLLTMEQKETVKMLQEEMKEQIQMVQSLIEQDESESEAEIQRLLGELEERIGKAGKTVFCKDAVLNTIFALKYARAQKENLEMDIKVESYVRTIVEDYDLCSIVANLIDNAIEAAKSGKDRGAERKPIQINVGQRGGYLVVKVENSIMEPLKKSKKGRYISSKREAGNSKEHGRGIAIVENALAKYDGYLRFEESKRSFVATAFLPVLECKNK